MSKSIDPATDPNIKERATKELLRVTLTEDEKVKQAERMAEKQAELEDLEDQKKAMVKDFASRIEMVQANVRQASNTYRQGWELRDVECVEIKDMNCGTLCVVRQDTGETVRMRKLSQSEMQGSLLDDVA